jgi:ketosteroid isomerase-like protein
LTTQSPKDVALGFFDDAENGRFAEAMARLAPDIAYDVVVPAPYGGVFDRDGLIAVITETANRLVEPMRLTITGVTAEGERVAIEAEGRAVTKAGKPHNNRFHFLFVVRDGVIVEAREYLDSAVYVELKSS